MKDLLCGLLSLTAIWQYLVYIINKHKRSYILATIAFVLALLAKPVAVVTLPIILILNYWMIRESSGENSKKLFCWMLVAIPIMIVTKIAQPDTALEFVPPLWARLFVAGDTLGFYLYKLLLPLSLSPYYGRSPKFVLAHEWGYYTWLIPFGTGALLWCWKNRPPWLVAAAGVFIVSVLPVLGLVPFRYQAHSTVADRYLYLSMLGPAIAFAYLHVHFRKMLVIYILALSLLGTLSSLQRQCWKNSVTLFSQVLALNPDSAFAHDELGSILARNGNIGEAITHFHRAIQSQPDYAKAHNNLGMALVYKGKTNEAFTHFSMAVQILPEYAQAHNNLGVVLVKQGKLNEAVKHFLKALAIQPHYHDAKKNLIQAKKETR